jgi:hypothetical protein
MLKTPATPTQAHFRGFLDHYQTLDRRMPKGITLPIPELSAGLAPGTREFLKATREVIREILGDDDDDGPQAVY